MVGTYQNDNHVGEGYDYKVKQVTLQNTTEREPVMVERKRTEILSKHKQSPLLLMQKNYQKRIYAEKEKRMINIFQENQRNTLQKISDNSSEKVKEYFGRKLEKTKNEKYSELNHTKEGRISYLPPLVKRTKNEKTLDESEKSSSFSKLDEGRSFSKRLAKLSINSSSTKINSNIERSNKRKIKPRLKDASDIDLSYCKITPDDNDDDIPINHDCLRLLRDKRVKEKKQELLKLNRQLAKEEFLNSPVRDDLNYNKNEYISNISELVASKTYKKQQKLNLSNSKRQNCLKKENLFTSTNSKGDCMKSVNRNDMTPQTEESFHEKATRSNPFASMTTEERDVINFNETYSKNKRRSKSKDNESLKNQVNSVNTFSKFHKPVKVRRDGRSTSNSMASAVSNQDTHRVEATSNKTSSTPIYQPPNDKKINRLQETQKLISQLTDDFEVMDYDENDLKKCKHCGRKFIVARLEKHKSVCQNRPHKKTRKTYNMAKARQRGTDLETFSNSRTRYAIKPQINLVRSQI